MDRHDPVEPGLFPRLLGRRVIAVEYDSWVDGDRDWLGVMFDGGTYLSVYATPGLDSDGERAWLEVGTRRRCPEPYRDEHGRPARRCRGFAGHGGDHS